MTVADKAIALLGHLQPADVRELPPAQRRHFAEVCRHLAAIADPPAGGVQRQAGVLGQLRSGQRSE